MNVSAAIKKGNKLSGSEVIKNENNQLFWKYKRQVVSFYANGHFSLEAEIVCIATRRENDHSDSMTDYCANTFHDNLTQAFRFADRMHLSSNLNSKNPVLCH